MCTTGSKARGMGLSKPFGVTKVSSKTPMLRYGPELFIIVVASFVIAGFWF